MSFDKGLYAVMGFVFFCRRRLIVPPAWTCEVFEIRSDTESPDSDDCLKKLLELSRQDSLTEELRNKAELDLSS